MFNYAPYLTSSNKFSVPRICYQVLYPNVIEVLKGCGDGPTRKNTAIVLARLCRHPKLNEKIRQLRGVEILMTLGKELGL